MADIYPYLVFENAKEAMDYYVQQFGAQIIDRRCLTKDQVESYGLELTNLDDTTAYGEFTIAGQTFTCADAMMAMPQTSSLVSILLDFADDNAEAANFFEHLAASDDQRVTLPFSPQPSGSQAGQIVDRYGITWLISAGFMSH
ncbi:MAG: VOC family protein [Limosilactobacillus gorillae]|uniref:VOC family protein n=1 Tax=Limosilactobacillus gorillae TaxID=1450649 RepID=UPI000ACA77FC|nr:VOC family protein [Limosilactobacillus gorillae]MDO4855752.1 VOC family protein [Limosilactobacillus gorillae]